MMKPYGSSIINYLLVFLLILYLLFALLVASVLIPREFVKPKMLESAEYMCENTTMFLLKDFLHASQIDHYADSITLSIAYFLDEDHPVDSSLWASYYGANSNRMNHFLLESLKDDVAPNQEYLRYTDNTYTTVSDTETEFSKPSAEPIALLADGANYKKADKDDTGTVTEIVVNSKTNNAATKISGLGGADNTTGTNYYLLETEAPSGYNKLSAPVIVNVKDNGTITVSLNGETLDSASDAFNVVNNSGTVLPSTGGIGTTIFYVVGSILVVAAGVLLITKKRMSREG